MKKTIPYIIGIVIIIAIIYFSNKISKNKNNAKPPIGSGSAPTASDIACGSGNPITPGANTPAAAICTKPIWSISNRGVKQKCWNSTDFNLGPQDSFPSIVTENFGSGKTWYFNYQNDQKGCYVDVKE